MTSSFLPVLELFRWLSSFSPTRTERPDAPWDAFADWALANGLAPLAAYNLEYRLGGGGAPETVRDRLLSIYQGSVNDNVMKLVNFKRSVDELEGRHLVLWGAAAWCDALYPHVAFRPVLQIDLLLRDADVDGLSGYLQHAHFRRVDDPDVLGRADHVLTDDHSEIVLHTSLFGNRGRTTEEDRALISRGVHAKVYGPSLFRFAHEDALLSLCVSMAREGFQVPMVEFVDLRELVLGASGLVGPYSEKPNAALVLERAKEWGVERALYASLRILQRLFPSTEEVTSTMLPELKRSTRELVERLVVKPVSELKSRSIRGSDRLRRWLLSS